MDETFEQSLASQQMGLVPADCDAILWNFEQLTFPIQFSNA